MDILFDDSASYIAAGRPEGRLWCCNPGAALALDLGDRVRSPEALARAADYDALWLSVVDATDAIAAAVRAFEAREDRVTGLATVLMPSVQKLARVLAMKALTLHAWMAETPDGERRVIGCPVLSEVVGGVLVLGRYDHVYAALSTALEDGPAVMETPRTEGAKLDAERDSVSRFDRAFNIVNRPASALAFKVWRALGKPIPGRERRVVILRDNEMIEESFPALLRAGWAPRMVNLGTGGGHATGDDVDLAGLERAVGDIWEHHLGAGLPPAMVLAAWRLFWPRVQAAFRHYPGLLGRARDEAARIAAQRGGEGEALLLLSNGLYDPFLRTLDVALREHGVPVLCTDHGVGIGLDARHDRTAGQFTGFADVYLTHNEETKAVYDRHKRDESQRYIVAGTPKVLRRCRFPALQRRLARRRCGVGGNERTLIYVVGLAANNMHQGYGTCTDTAYFDFQRRLLDVLGRFPGRVVVKPYPANRFADPDPVWSMPLPENASLAPFGEFRQLRWAADILVVDLCSSTLGWALGPDIPLIYVDNVANPMNARAKAAARAGVFLVDAMTDGWEDEARALMALPVAEVTAAWRAKAAARRGFGERFLFGPPRPVGPAIVAALDDMAAAPPERTETEDGP